MARDISMAVIPASAAFLNGAVTMLRERPAREPASNLLRMCPLISAVNIPIAIRLLSTIYSASIRKQPKARLMPASRPLSQVRSAMMVHYQRCGLLKSRLDPLRSIGAMTRLRDKLVLNQRTTPGAIVSGLTWSARRRLWPRSSVGGPGTHGRRCRS